MLTHLKKQRCYTVDMLVVAETIFPSQNFLKPDTVRFIFSCFQNGHPEKLPPSPIVREDGEGNLVAIDGHNVVAVQAFRHESVDVIVASSREPVLPDTSDANRVRNRMLAQSFESVLLAREQMIAQGVLTFGDLIAKYPQLFTEAPDAW